jgi:hypothetical protein
MGVLERNRKSRNPHASEEEGRELVDSIMAFIERRY